MENNERELFQSKYIKDESGCWLWKTTIGTEYYGQFRGKRAHRVSYELYMGPIPEGLVLDHLCRVHGCVNPEHLEPVTQKENTLRGIGIPAKNAQKTHCERGHEFNDENIYRTPKGRHCQKCLYEYRRSTRPRAMERRLATQDYPSHYVKNGAERPVCGTRWFHHPKSTWRGVTCKNCLKVYKSL